MLAVFAIVLASRVFALAAPPATSGDVAALHSVVQKIASTYPMNTARLGVSVVDARTGLQLYDRDASKEFAPASNFKLLVAASALAYLGPSFRYTTELLARGPLDGGALRGDLILVGGGDPILARADLAHAVRAVAAAGIKRIDGAVLIDDSLFDEQRYGSGWAWDDFPYYYQPPIQALSIDEGLVDVTARAGRVPGDPVSATIRPNGGAMSVVSDAVTTGAKGLNDIDCFRSPGSTLIHVVGHYPLGSKPITFGCTVDDSAAFAASMLTQMLDDAHIFVSSAALGQTPPRGAKDIEDASPPPPPAARYGILTTTLWTHHSPPLTALLKRMMPPSDNFMAEHLFKMLPVAALRQRGTFDGGAEVERKFIASLGLDPASIDNGDGSGLSQGDRITPRDLTTVLWWETRSTTGHAYVDALARAGINGTVRHHLLGSDAVGRVRAKDGYIWHVSTFTGYANTKHHGLVVFSVMFNDANGSLKPFLQAEDKIVETIVDWP